jgi:hypothetical protein
MKLKSLLFGSAAVIAAGTGAQAADLPTAEPVEYVRICDAFGPGFYYIPGTDTCLKVGGYVRVDSAYVGGDDVDILYRYGYAEVPFPTISLGEQSYAAQETFNHYYSYARGHIVLDARSQTPVGMVRAYIAYNITNNGTDFGPSNDTKAALDVGFVQVSNDWGTLTVGRTGSFFDPWGSDTYGDRLNIDDPTQGSTNLAAFTFSGGNGFSFTIAAEDPYSNGRNDTPLYGYQGGHNSPDGVANIRIDQGWGSAQVMAAVHPLHGYDYYDGDYTTELGWAVGGALSVGIPGGWTANIVGGYSQGALKYITNDICFVCAQFSGASGTTVGGGAVDLVGLQAGDYFVRPEWTNTAWSIRGGISGPLGNPNLTVWLNGSYTEVDLNFYGNDDIVNAKAWAAVAGAAYQLAPGLKSGPEVAYTHQELNFDIGGGYTIGESDIWGVMWRTQMNF